MAMETRDTVMGNDRYDALSQDAKQDFQEVASQALGVPIPLPSFPTARLLEMMVDANIHRRELVALGIHVSRAKRNQIADSKSYCARIADALYEQGWNPQQLDDVLEARTGSRE